MSSNLLSLFVDRSIISLRLHYVLGIIQLRYFGFQSAQNFRVILSLVVTESFPMASGFSGIF
jgi:hypothetical protein